MNQHSTAIEPKKPSYYVGVGASAGGLEAIEQFFAQMPSDTGMAFIVIQHLSPDYKSMMVELLSKRTALKVQRAEDGLQVEPDTIFLIPPKTNLTIFHGRLLLTAQQPGHGLNLPIDIFLRSLAEDQGDHAVGIILSGTGSDGMRGIRAIKEAGGMVMAQDPESAKFDGMPRSAISTGLTDFVLPAEELATQLLRYSEFPYSAKAEVKKQLNGEQTILDRLFALLRNHSKVDFTHYKPSTVLRRIERRMTINQIPQLREYVLFLDHNPRELTTLYKELLIGVTSFFRDQEAFQFLQNECLPALLRQEPDKDKRFWVAGCSTGEEAYSLAILCREIIEKEHLSCDVKIFATDIDQHAILRAGSGVYPASIVADLSPELQQKYFHVLGDEYQINRELREMVVFAKHNLICDPPFTNIDFISCRNLLIYLQPSLQHKVMDFFNFSLKANGILFLGSSETIGQHTEFFEPLQHKWKIYRSRGRRGQHLENTLQDRPFTPLRSTSTNRAQPRFGTPLEEQRLLERFVQSLADTHLPLTLLVNDRLELLYTLGDSKDILSISPGPMQYTISNIMFKELSIPVSTSIQRAFNHQKDVAYSNISFPVRGKTERLEVRVHLLPGKRNQEPLAAVFISEMPQTERVAKSSASSETTYNYDEGVAEHMADLEQELQFAKENLQATIEELETSNEELQATNEELLASNEELQSTNEELQSVNEELHTVNAEHQLKILELTQTTNDLDNLLNNTRQGFVFLDENLEIRRFTEDISDVLQIRASDLGRPLEHLSHRLVNMEHPVSLARQVLSARAPIEREVHNDDGIPFFMRILPYQIGQQQYSGLVISFTNLSTLRNTELALEESERKLRQATKMASIGSWTYYPETNETVWSDEIYTIYRIPKDQHMTPEAGMAFYTDDSRPKIQAAFEACTQGIGFDEVLQIKDGAGQIKWVRAIGTPIMANSKLVRIEGAFQDVSRLVHAEQSLQDLRDKKAT